MPKSSPFIIIVLLAILTSACNLPAGRKSTPQNPAQPDTSLIEYYPVDPIFQGLYDFLGGEALAGPAIAPLVDSGDLKTQYIQAGQMVYDPQAPESDRFQLESLGRMFGIAEPAVPEPGISGVRYSNGHIILNEFVPIYDKLGGARFVGRPLTEGRHNPERQRIEQYFENLGFYRLENEPPGIVHLMAYGAMACPQDCRALPPQASIPSQDAYLPPPFAQAASRLGLDFTGLTLSSPYLNEEEEMEVIFENIVLTMGEAEDVQDISEILLFHLWLPKILSNVQEIKESEISLQLWLPVTVKITSGDHLMAEIKLLNPIWLPMVRRASEPGLGKLHLKPIVQMLGIEPTPPVFRLDDPLSVFYPTEGELGHNVPVLFDKYLKRFGGIPVVGKPISEVFHLQDSIFRQCFTNLCVDFDTSGDGRLNLAPLGLEYQKQYYPEPGPEPKWKEQGNVRLTIEEEKDFVSPGESQQIRVVMTENDIPLVNWEPVLTITLPDGTQQMFRMKPTDEHGISEYRLPPIEAKNATLIPYEVCITIPGGEQLCVEENYPVWDFNP